MSEHGTAAARPVDAYTRRRAELRLMGFATADARALAAAHAPDGTPVPIQEIRRALDAGCSHELALRIWR
jgi:hypothetical protein